MSYRTHEIYDEHEYFIKFKAIHPYVFYSKDEYIIKKKEFQLKLLDNLKSYMITEDQFKEMYTLLITKENDKDAYLEQIKTEQKKIIKKIEEELNTEIMEYMDFII